MTYNEDFFTRQYRTEWADCDNVVISLFDQNDPKVQIGIIELKLFKPESKHPGEAYLWNLYINKEYRGKGHGQHLLDEALDTARKDGYKVAVLEWDLRDSPRWVAFWYARQGYDEKEFSNVYALMKKEL